MKILIVGDSQAGGPVGRDLEQSLQSAGHTTRRIYHTGHGAADWSRMHWPEYEAALQQLAPDHVILIFGSNDLPNTALEAAFRRFASSASEVWYAGPPRYPTADLQTKSAGIRDMAKRVFGPKHLDAWPYSGSDVPRAADQVHFGPAGGAVWAQGIFRDWRNVRSSPVVASLAAAGIPVWGPIVIGVAGALALGAWVWSRR